MFVNNNYTSSKPGTEILQLLEYKTRGDLFEAGLSYPFIRSREKNLIATALFFMSNDRSEILGALNTLDRIRGIRLKADFDFVDQLRAINQINVVVSQGIRGAGQLLTRHRASIARERPIPPSPRSRRPSAACSPCPPISRCCWRPMACGLGPLS